MRALILDSPSRRDRRGGRIAARDPLRRELDATLASVLAYAGRRPESEALPLTFDQIGRRTITFRATKSGVVVERETRLLEPLARDLRRWRLRCPPTDDGLVFAATTGERWTGDDLGAARSDVIGQARDAVAAGAVPPRYRDDDPSGGGGI